MAILPIIGSCLGNLRFVSRICIFNKQGRRICLHLESDLTKKSQTVLEKQFNDALLDNKVVVFVRDTEQETLVSSLYNLDK